MIIRNADINGQVTDIRLASGRIAEIAKGMPSGRYFDAKGGALIPGLHDHHIHLNATAAAMNSVHCGPSAINSENELINSLNQLGKGWLRGVGYHHSVAGEIDRDWLDKNGPERPVRIQHRSGRLWILNSKAMASLELINPKDGRLYDSDALIRKKSNFPDLDPLIKRLLSYGITGVTEVTPSNGVKELNNYLSNVSPIKIAVMGNEDLAEGYLKLHYHDHNLPSLETLSRQIALAHTKDRPIAAHCVTRAELMLTLAAIEEANAHPLDRIEHAAIADDTVIEWMKRLDITVVTQPNFIAERVEAYQKDVPKADHCNLWRLKAFLEAGLKLAAGSDAPFGDLNPWKAMKAAVRRPVGFEGEAVSPEEALLLYTKPKGNAGADPRHVTVGEVADLCLLDCSWLEARKDFEKVSVRGTWIDGRLVYNGVNQAPL